MRISIIVEGQTEGAFIPLVREFLRSRLAGKMPKLVPLPYDGRIPKREQLRKLVIRRLTTGSPPFDAVIALTDVYTGISPPDFADAVDAKNQMRSWVGDEPRFYPHAAQHDVEAWLIPFWADIQRLARHNRAAPKGTPESINHTRPPSVHVRAMFADGKCRNHYSKVRDAAAILRGKNLTIAANQCPELKSFLNTILSLCGGEKLP